MYDYYFECNVFMLINLIKKNEEEEEALSYLISLARFKNRNQTASCLPLVFYFISVLAR